MKSANRTTPAHRPPPDTHRHGVSAMPDTVDKDAAPARNSKRRMGLIVLTALFVTAAMIYALLYFFVFTWRESTDDAYVGGNQVTITPQVSGTVIAILADDTQLVQAGQTLVRLDPADADVTLDQARTALAQAVRQVRQQFAQDRKSTR